jgi:hypothetical protein
MTRKLTRNYSLCVVAAFIAILILVIAASVLAQTSGAGQSSRKADAVSAPAGTAVLAQVERPATPWTDSAETFAVSRSQKNRSGAAPMGGNPLQFLPVVAYDSGGLGASSLTVGDLNGDGYPDIVATNADSDTVGVLLGNGDGTFRAPVSYSSGGRFPGRLRSRT